ncbi:MAG: cobalamin B12-binding domain-containing protein [Phycicoccus sp.]|nr:cobalamin B12-binding domain-containing protein [Phycicoccus sp.]NMM34030.1 cobalamin B12-binding domain-containing protein [Phycicoccus sp.]
MNHENEVAVLRIGELSRRVGVSEHVLRAWETRYGLLSPARSAGGFRLYSEDDENRVRRMQAHLANGLAAAQAATAAIAEDQSGTISRHPQAVIDAAPQADLAECADGLRQALDEMDEPAAQAMLDRLFTDFTVETVLRDALMPYLHDLGARWAEGAVSVGQEHFASHVVRSRLTGLARGWGNGRGPRALLACPPDEVHDLALLVFGIVLNRRGWRVQYLGASTPLPDMIQVTAQTRPSLVVLAATTPERFEAVLPELSTLAEMAPLVLAGAGATAELAQRIGARVLSGDPVSAAANFVGSLS